MARARLVERDDGSIWAVVRQGAGDKCIAYALRTATGWQAKPVGAGAYVPYTDRQAVCRALARLTGADPEVDHG